MVGFPSGKGRAIVFHPTVKTIVRPTVVKAFSKGGVNYYRDSAGKDHVAEIFDQTWGKRDPGAILPARKGEFQRTFR